MVPVKKGGGAGAVILHVLLQQPVLESSENEGGQASAAPEFADGAGLPSREISVEREMVENTRASPASPIVIGGEAGSGGRVLPEGYLPRSRLSAPARPLSDIKIPWPPGLPTIGVQSAVFTLFIDELGFVREMVADAHTISPPLEEAARRTFMESRFSPAQVDGRSVKSIQRIEVFFEFLPVQGDPAVIVNRKGL